MSQSEILTPTYEIGNTSFYESHVRPVVVEFIGTTILVFLVCMFPATSSTIYQSAFVYGFATLFLIVSFGDISGGHFNPAITLGCTLAGALPISLSVCYFIAQILGGMLGAAFVRAVYPLKIYKTIVGGSTVLNIMQGMKPGWGVMTEALLTFIIVLTFLHSVVDKRSKLAPLSVGVSVAACSFVGAFSTGGSMNPARSLGPAIAFSVYSDYVDDLIWKYHYIYWVGPLAGTLFAALMYRFVLASVNRRIRLL